MTVIDQPVGLIDMAQYFAMAVNGFDPLEQSFKDITSTMSPTTISTFPYTFPPTPGGDFELDVTFPGMFSSFINNVTSLTFGIGATDGQNASYYGILSFPTGGINVTYAFGVANITRIKSNSAQDIRVVISVSSHFLTISVNNQVAWQEPVLKPTVGFSPKLTVGNPVAGMTMVVNRYVVGSPRAYTKVAKATDVYGPINTGAFDISLAPGGGNGINKTGNPPALPG